LFADLLLVLSSLKEDKKVGRISLNKRKDGGDINEQDGLPDEAGGN